MMLLVELVHGRIADEARPANQPLEDQERHGALQVRLADAGIAHAIQPREPQARIRRQLDRLVPHGAVAIDGNRRGLFFIEELLEGQRLLAGFEDVLLGGLDHLDRTGDPALGLGPGRLIVDGLVRRLHALEGDLLDFRSELRLDLGNILRRQLRSEVEDLRLAQMMDRSERPDRRSQLLAVGSQQAFQPCAQRLLQEGSDAGPLVPRIRRGEEHRGPAQLEDLQEGCPDADAQVNNEDAVQRPGACP